MSLFNSYKAKKQVKRAETPKKLRKMSVGAVLRDNEPEEIEKGENEGAQCLNLASMQTQNAMKRVENWAGDFLVNPDLQKALEQGVVPLLPQVHHNFRLRHATSANISKNHFFPLRQ